MSPECRRSLLVTAILLLAVCMVAPAMAATTSVEIRKYANDGTTILNSTTVNYTWMMDNLPVMGDGITHYYHQGPVFIDDPDAATQEMLRWNPEEDTNVLEKDMGAVKGTNLKDLCDLVGGMSPGEEVKILSSDGWNRMWAYKNVYEYSDREGPIGICWFKDGKYPDSGYSEGMRMVWFADDSVNTLGPNGTGVHAFGNWDWHEAADEKYWYYYQQGNEKYPTTTGLSGQYVNRIYIYSNEAPPAQLDVIFEGTVTLADGTFTWTDDSGDDYEVSTLTPHGALEAAFLADGFTYGGSWHGNRNTALINWIDSGTANYTYDGTVTPKLAWNYQKNGVYQNYFSNTTGVSNNDVADGDFLEFYFGPDQQTTDNATAVLRITVNIQGGAVPPVAAFTSDIQSGTAPLTVHFTDQSTGSPTSWAWDFTNDGVVDSIAQNPSHTYSAPGTYTVRLNVTNAEGSDEEVKTGYITVTEAPPASEFLAGWSYRKLVTIGGSPDGDLTDYQVRFTVHRADGTDSGENVYLGTRVKADYSDLRFTTTGNVLLPYWIEPSETGSAVAWVKVPSIPVTGTQVYLYYGNPVAVAVSNGDDTFPFFDDFPGTSLNAGKWDSMGSPTVSGGICTLSSTGNAVLIEGKESFGQNYAVRSRLKSAHFASTDFYEYFNFLNPATFAGGYVYYSHSFGPGMLYNYNTGFSNPELITGWTANTYAIQDIIRSGSTNVMYLVNDANQKAISEQMDSSSWIPQIYVSGENSRIDVDWVLVRKCTVTPPAIAAWGAEEEEEETPPPAIPELFNGTVNLAPGSTFNKVAYNSQTSYTVSWTTPLGALQATGLTYNVTDKRWSSDQVLLLDDVEEYIRNSPGNWFAYVNGVYKDGYGNHANGLNVIELSDGDRVDFYYAAGVGDKNNLTETLSKATAAVRTVADTSGSAPPGDWTLSLSGAISKTITRSEFEAGVACQPSHSATYTDGDGNVWGGIPLWFLVGWVDDENMHGPFNDALAAEGYSVKVTAGDGYSINFESGDIARDNGYIVANTLNGEPLPLTKPNSTKLCFPLQMIGPKVSSGKLVGNIVSIELVGLPEPPAGWTLRMEGDVVDIISQQYFEQGIACTHGVTYTDGTGNTWGGVPLWDLVGAVDDIETTSHWTFNDTRANVTGYTVRVIAGDGFNATFSSLDISHNNGFIVANTLNGTPLTGSDANLKLVGPATTGGKQRIGNITTIRLEGLPGYPAGDWSLELIGAISDTIPQPEFEDWAACHHATYDDGEGKVYEGIPLWRIMGWVDDRIPHGPNGFNNALATAGYTVIVTAGDGYSKELTSQEIGTDNRFIIANKVNGEPLSGTKAPLQLVGSGLPSASYSVGNIASIKLTAFQEPTEIPTITIIKYANDGTTILSQTTVDHIWMEANLPVIGDGTTHYMYQGLTMDPDDIWDPTETKGMSPPKIDNAIKATKVRDLCELVGGMEPGTEIKFVATDNFETILPYDAIYPNPHVYSHLGESVIAWYADGNYVPKFGDGPRLFFTPEDHVVGQWNMHEALPEQYWHYNWNGGVQYPSVAGLSAKYISTIKIYSAPAADWSLLLDGEDIGGMSETISRNYFESALACQFGANHKASYTDSAGRTWEGMPLWFLAGYVDDDDQHSNDGFNNTLAAAGYDVKVTAGDGYSTTIPSEQIIRNSNYLIANSLNGTPIPGDDQNWPLRLTGQNVTGGMAVKGVASIHLLSRPSSGEPEVKIVPAQSALSLDTTAPYQILLTTAPAGLAGYDLQVTLGNPAVGEIVTVEYPAWAELSNTTPQPPADTLRLSGVDIGRNIQAGSVNVLLATITVRADSMGTTPVTISGVHMDADGGAAISPKVTSGEIAVHASLSADFEANVTSGKASASRPLFVAFTDLSTGTPPASSWSWDFDNDGVVDSTLQNPVASYVNPGNYTVSLTVENAYSSDTETKSDYIRVTRYVKPFPGQSNDPTDPDGDFLYEDINGNGRLDYDDVVLYYENMQWIRDQDDVGIEPYDYNQNGRIDYDDVVLLYQELLASHP